MDGGANKISCLILEIGVSFKWNLPLPTGSRSASTLFEMHLPDGIVQRFAINRQPRMLRLAEQHDEIGQRGFFLHGDDVGARHHNVFNFELAEFQQIGEHGALLHRQIGTLAIAFLDHLLQAFAYG